MAQDVPELLHDIHAVLSAIRLLTESSPDELSATVSRLAAIGLNLSDTALDGYQLKKREA